MRIDPPLQPAQHVIGYMMHDASVLYEMRAARHYEMVNRAVGMPSSGTHPR